jgi:plasmid stabilization system protein ParE
MEFDIIVHPNVELDLQKAYEYHFKNSPPKARKLIDVVGELLASIKVNPYYQIRYKNIRGLYLGKGLNYILFYTVDVPNLKIEVIAFLHSSVDQSRYPK